MWLFWNGSGKKMHYHVFGKEKHAHITVLEFFGKNESF